MHTHKHTYMQTYASMHTKVHNVFNNYQHIHKNHTTLYVQYSSYTQYIHTTPLNIYILLFRQRTYRAEKGLRHILVSHAAAILPASATAFRKQTKEETNSC